jgi:mxaJ protein
MFSRFKFVAIFLLLFMGSNSESSDFPVLRVCSDPNNLPFSNRRLEGFENKIAEVIAQDLNAKVEYTWWAQRRGFIRNTLKAGLCDVVMGMPTSMEMALTSRPYYRSSYVFVYRKSAPFNLRSFDDPILHNLKIGVQMIGDDAANTPPVHALNRRKIVNNLVGFTVYGNYDEPNPPVRIIDAVAKGTVDAAVAWGPMAAFYAAREKIPLQIVPVSPQIDLPYLPFVFDISAGVRRGDEKLLNAINQSLIKQKAKIDHILDSYNVPRFDLKGNRITKSL